MWFSREISTLWSEPTEHVQAILGVRQSGKTSLLARLAGPARRFVTLDDAGALDLAVSDPRLFLATFPPPVIIDECQLAAPLFPAIKVVVDEWRRAQRPVGDASIWLTGSHQMLVDARIAESLAGRVGLATLHPFSLAEAKTASVDATLLLRGLFPRLWAEDAPPATRWLDDYIRTVLERDVALLFGIEKIAAFIKCARLLAGHIGQLLNMSEIARGAGVKASTISDWTGALARMGFFHFVEPWSVNPVSRLVKAPKVYACDPGVAARLQGWSEAGPLAVSPAVGPLFENLTFLEILKARDHHGRAWRISTLRSRDGEEVDFVVEDGSNRAVAVEAKMTRPSLAGLKPPTTLGRLLPGARYVVVSAADGPTIERPDVTLLPLARLAGHLLEHLG
jgi:predicted AAA+ superfamily ATPase